MPIKRNSKYEKSELGRYSVCLKTLTKDSIVEVQDSVEWEHQGVHQEGPWKLCWGIHFFTCRRWEATWKNTAGEWYDLNHSQIP